MSNATDTRTRHINPDCHACDGTGTDSAFGGDCVECERDAGRAALLRAAYSADTDPRTDRAYTPGERLDGRTFGGVGHRTAHHATPKQIAYLRRLIDEAGDRGHATFAEIANGADFDELSKAQVSGAIDALKGFAAHDAAEARPANAPTDKQVAFLTKLIDERPGNGEAEAARAALATGKLDRRSISRIIDVVKAEPRTAEPRTAEAPADDDADEVETADVPDGHYAIESTGHNDLAFYRVDNGGRYGVSVRLIVGGRSDSWVSRRNVPGILARIADAGVETARQRYAAEIGSCWVCNRTLTDDESRRLGIGPDCRKRHG